MTKVTYNSYDIVARARNQTPIFYREFGSYQGEWIMVARDESNYYIYKDYYGSCSGCDSLQASHGYDDSSDLGSNKFEMGSKAVEDFIKEYPPFATVPHQVMKTKVQNGTLKEIMPLNVGYDISGEDVSVSELQISLVAKSYEGIITPPEILEIDNLESRREAIDRYGEERFMDELGGDVLDSEGENQLVSVKRQPEDFVFVKVKDSSTPRKYMLRVPPSTKTVREGIAWTFKLKPEEYVLEQET